MGATKLMTAAGGGITLDAASTASDKTITVPAVTDTMLTRTTNVNSGTAVASTSGTSIDFTGIPSWVKRITVMFQGVSTNGTSITQVRLGTSGGVVATGYSGYSYYVNTGSTSAMSTGFNIDGTSLGATATRNNILTLVNISGNSWIFSGNTINSNDSGNSLATGNITLSGALDRIRITTVNGTDTFDAGSINILYE